MALLSNALVRVHPSSGQTVIMLVYNDTEMFDKYNTGTDNFVMAETVNVNGKLEVHLKDECFHAAKWYEKVGIDASHYTIDMLATARIWVCQKVKSIYESAFA